MPVIHRKKIKKQVTGNTGNTVDTLISQPYFVNEGFAPAELSAELSGDKTIRAMAVMRGGLVTGVITRSAFFEAMSAGNCSEIDPGKYVFDTQVLSGQLHPFDIWERYSMDRLIDKIWFAVTDRNGEYSGLFSSIDLLNYLSGTMLTDMSIANTIQSRINGGGKEVQTGTFSIASFSLPAKGIGGDLVFYSENDDGSMIFALFDVSGKGTSASLVTGIIFGILSFAHKEVPIDTLIRRMNRILNTTFQNELFVTGVIGRIEQDGSAIMISDLGHSHCYTFPHPRHVCSETGTLPLGIDSDITPKFMEIELKPGENIVIMSDGIIEQKNDEHRPFDINTAFRILGSGQSKPLSECLTQIAQEYRTFIGLKSQHDDASMIVIRRDE